MIRIDRKKFEQQFKKLPQLDRIELRQRQKVVISNWGWSPIPLLILTSTTSILAMLTFMTAFLGAPHYGDNWFKAFYNVSGLLAQFSIGLFLGTIIAKCLVGLNISHQLKKLLLEYCPKARRE